MGGGKWVGHRSSGLPTKPLEGVSPTIGPTNATPPGRFTDRRTDPLNHCTGPCNESPTPPPMISARAPWGWDKPSRLQTCPARGTADLSRVPAWHAAHHCAQSRYTEAGHPPRENSWPKWDGSLSQRQVPLQDQGGPLSATGLSTGCWAQSPSQWTPCHLVCCPQYQSVPSISHPPPSDAGNNSFDGIPRSLKGQTPPDEVSNRGDITAHNVS